MSDRSKAIVCITVSAFGFALMAMLVRLCDDYGETISCFQKSFFRNVVAFVVSMAVFCRKIKSAGCDFGFLRWRPMSVLLLRSVVGTVGIFANFYALSRISIADGQTLNKTAPFFTVLFAWIFLGERINLRQTLALALAFSGVVFVAKPGFAGADSLALLVGLSGGVAAGGAYACLRSLAGYRVDGAFIVLFFSAFSCLASVPFMFYGFDPMSVQQLLIMIAAGVFAAVGQFGITAAYRFAAPRSIVVFDYTNIIFTAALGFLFFAQIPDLWSILGFVVIVLAAIVMSGKETGGKDETLRSDR